MSVERFCATCGQIISAKRRFALTREDKLVASMLQAVECKHCGHMHHLECVSLDCEPTTTFYCPSCLNGPLKGVRHTFVLGEADEPGYMSFASFRSLAARMVELGMPFGGHNRVHSSAGRPKRRNPRVFSFQDVEVVWELFAGTSGDSLGLKSAGYPPPSVVVERDQHCHPMLMHNCCNPTIFRYVQAGHDNSMIMPSRFATQVLKLRSNNRKHTKYKVHVLISCLPCTPYSPLGQGWGFRSGSGRAFCELFRLLLDSPVDSGFIEQSPHFCTAAGGKCFHMLLHGLHLLNYKVAWVVHNTCDGGCPQDRTRLYLEYVLHGGPDPAGLLALDLCPSMDFIAEREAMRARSHLPDFKGMVQFSLHASNHDARFRADGLCSTIVRAPRRAAFAGTYTRPGSTDAIISGPIHPNDLLGLQELRQGHVQKAPTTTSQYESIGNARSGEVSSAIFRGHATAVAAARHGQSEQQPDLEGRLMSPASLQTCMAEQARHPSAYSGGVSTGVGHCRLLESRPKRPPLWNLSQFLTHLPEGRRRELPSGVTYLTRKEAAHVVHCQHTRLQGPLSDLMQHLIEAASDEHSLSKYRDGDFGHHFPSRGGAASLEDEDIDAWAEELALPNAGVVDSAYSSV